MSSTSLINGGLLRSTFKRYWPLWLGFFCAWIVLHVMPLFGMLSVVAPDAFESVDLAAAQQNSWYLMQGQILPITWAGAIIAAVYLNERLFKAQAATFYGSLPLRRSTVFVTTVFAVFVPMVLVEALVALVLLALTSTIAGVSAYMVAQWFVLAAGFTFVFCSIAQLACEVTGSRAVAGLLYLLANVLAACIEGAISLISQVLLFGVQISEMTLDWASPAVGLLRGCLQGEALGSSNWMLLGMYCLMAVV